MLTMVPEYVDNGGIDSKSAPILHHISGYVRRYSTSVEVNFVSGLPVDVPGLHHVNAR